MRMHSRLGAFNFAHKISEMGNEVSSVLTDTVVFKVVLLPAGHNAMQLLKHSANSKELKAPAVACIWHILPIQDTIPQLCDALRALRAASGTASSASSRTAGSSSSSSSSSRSSIQLLLDTATLPAVSTWRSCSDREHRQPVLPQLHASLQQANSSSSSSSSSSAGSSSSTAALSLLARHMEDCLYRAASSMADYKAQAAQTEPLRWVAGQFLSTLQQQPQQGEIQKTEKRKKRKQRDNDSTSERSGKQRATAAAAASSPAQRSATGT
jgi:hypothetical protein